MTMSNGWVWLASWLQIDGVIFIPTQNFMLQILGHPRLAVKRNVLIKLIRFVNQWGIYNR